MFSQESENDRLTQDCDYHRQRAEEAERQLREIDDEQLRRHEEARLQREREYEESLRYPADWTEAFDANRTLMNREIESPEHAVDEQDAAFIQGQNQGWEKDVHANDFAQRIYLARIQVLRDEFEQRKRELLSTIADQVEQEYPGATVIDFLREDDPIGYVNW